MEENPIVKRAITPYIILAIVTVCTVLILSELWANVSPLVPHPWEGPTPTPTLWWRSSQPTPSASLLPTVTPPAVSGEAAEDKPAQSAGRVQVVGDE